MPLLAASRGLAGLTLLLCAAFAVACPARAAGSEGHIVDFSSAELAGKGPLRPDDVGNEQRFTVLQPAAGGFTVIGGASAVTGDGTTASIAGGAGEQMRPRRGARPQRIILIEYGVVRVPGRPSAGQADTAPGGTASASPVPAERAPAREVVPGG
jgi:hypothetical protein